MLRRRQARALLEAGDVEAARAVIGDDVALRHELAEVLLDSGRLDLGQALLGHTGGSSFDAFLQATPADPELDGWLAEAGAKNLPGDARVLELSRALLERGQTEPALSLLERAALSTRKWELLRAAIEACIAAKAWAHAKPLVEASLGAIKQLRGTAEHDFLLKAHEQVIGNLEGAEAVTVDLMMRGELDPFMGRKHLLLVKALMRGSPKLASRLTLVSAPQELREGDDRLSTERKSAPGLLLVGSAKLRLGELDDAIVAFERGRDVAPRHFALVAGLGAARALSQEHGMARVRSLPDLGVVEGISSLLPDLEQLTMLELRVAQASVKPLSPWLPALAGKRLRILPLDVRVTDLPEFAAGQGEEPGLGLVRVEELLDTRPVGWPLARELAYLVHQVLPEPRLEREAFAVAYTRWLCGKYGLEARVDDPGFEVIQAVVA